MASLIWISLIVLLPAVVWSQTQTQDCLVDNFVTQANFDIDRFAGKWYEISWVPFYFEPPFDNYRDYIVNFTVLSDTYVRNNDAGRVKEEDDKCNHAVWFYNVSTSDPARWERNATVECVDYHVDYWIMGTDYDNYAFVYGCTRKLPNGLCQDDHAWKFSRRPTLADNFMTILDEHVERVCMGNYTFDPSPQTKACPDQPPPAPTTPKPTCPPPPPPPTTTTTTTPDPSGAGMLMSSIILLGVVLLLTF